MIEGVNSVLTNASTLQAASKSADPVTRPGVSDGSEAALDNAPSATYLSPRVQVNGGRPVIEIRDSNTGTVVNQYPSEQRLRQLALLQASQVDTTTTVSDTDVSEQPPLANADDVSTDIDSRADAAISAEAQAATQAFVSGAEASGQVETLSAGVDVTA